MEHEREELCFGCGKDNPVGLKLKFKEKDNCYIAEFTAQKYYQGYPNILHGGITTAILDEAMGNYLFNKGLIALTAEITVRFKKEIPVEEPLTITAMEVAKKSRMIQMKSEIKLQDGATAAEATAKFIIKGHTDTCL